MKRLWVAFQDYWCYAFHAAPRWPVNGRYRCPSCDRTYPVPWENNEPRHACREGGKPRVQNNITAEFQENFRLDSMGRYTARW
jgi:hypothetical protein